MLTVATGHLGADGHALILVVDGDVYSEEQQSISGAVVPGHGHWAVENAEERRIGYVAHNPALLAQIVREGSGVATFS